MWEKEREGNVGWVLHMLEQWNPQRLFSYKCVHISIILEIFSTISKSYLTQKVKIGRFLGGSKEG